MCVQEMIELISMSQRQRLSPTKISEDLSFAAKIKQQQLQKNFPGVAKAGIMLHRVGICHSMAMALGMLLSIEECYKPVLDSSIS